MRGFSSCTARMSANDWIRPRLSVRSRLSLADQARRSCRRQSQHRRHRTSRNLTSFASTASPAPSSLLKVKRPWKFRKHQLKIHQTFFFLLFLLLLCLQFAMICDGGLWEELGKQLGTGWRWLCSFVSWSKQQSLNFHCTCSRAGESLTLWRQKSCESRWISGRQQASVEPQRADQVPEQQWRLVGHLFRFKSIFRLLFFLSESRGVKLRTAKASRPLLLKIFFTSLLDQCIAFTRSQELSFHIQVMSVSRLNKLPALFQQTRWVKSRRKFSAALLSNSWRFSNKNNFLFGF